MIAIRRPQTPELAVLASPATFALGALLVAVAFAMALSRSGTSASISVVGLAAMFALALGAVAYLRDNAAERLLQVFIFLIPLNFFVMGGSLVSIERASFGFRMSASDLIFPALLLILVRKRMDAGSPMRTRTILLFVGLIAALTVSWAQSALYLGVLSSYSTGKFLGLVYLVIFAAVAVEVIRDRVWWGRSIDTLALSGVACGLIGIAGWLAFTATGAANVLIEGDRLSSTMWGDPNIFASLMAFSFTLSLMRIRIAKGGERWFWGACTAVAVIALMLSQSRSGTIAAGVGLLVLAMAFRPALVLTIAAVLLGVFALLWSLHVLFDLPVSLNAGGLWNEQRFSSATVGSRTQYLQTGLKLLPTEGLPGIGLGSFEQTNFVRASTTSDYGYVRAHNSYLSAVLELGITGILALLLFGAAVLSAVRDGYRHLDPEDRWRLSGLVAAGLGIMLFAFFVDTLYQRHLWVLIVLLFAIPNVIATSRIQAVAAENE